MATARHGSGSSVAPWKGSGQWTDGKVDWYLVEGITQPMYMPRFQD